MTHLTDTAPPPAPSLAEQSRSARIGAFLFRNRSWLPALFVLVPLIAPGRMTPMEWIVGGALIALGECFRLTGVAAAGTETRRRSRDVHRLVTYGVFAWVRNPLYLGNLLIWMGFVVISGVYWFLPLALAVFAIEYSLIVRYEEGVLESFFGDEYLAYRDVTPRWVPRPPRKDVAGEHDWGEAWYSERSTFLQYAALIAAFVAKQRLLS